MKRYRVLLVASVVVLLTLAAACDTNDTKSFNEKMNPGQEIDVQGYRITLPSFQGRQLIFCKEYSRDGSDLILYTWWTDGGAVLWNPKKYTGEYRIAPPYTIEPIIVSSIPKE